MMTQNKKYTFPSLFPHIELDTDQWNSSKSDMKYMFHWMYHYIQKGTLSTNMSDMKYMFQSCYHCNLKGTGWWNIWMSGRKYMYLMMIHCSLTHTAQQYMSDKSNKCR